MATEIISDLLAIELYWSTEDQAYICRLKNEHGVSTHGETIPDALREFGTVLAMVVEGTGFRALTRDPVAIKGPNQQISWAFLRDMKLGENRYLPNVDSRRWRSNSKGIRKSLPGHKWISKKEDTGVRIKRVK